jgi:dTDP-4-dehydrorhamnose 3,5-epimerase
LIGTITRIGPAVEIEQVDALKSAVAGNFRFRRLAIPDVVLIRPRRSGDERGYFMETFRAADFAAFGIPATFVQDNQAMSARAGTIRGLHFQKPPSAQAKLVRVLRGAIFDVAVDIRRDSPTCGKWVGATLTTEGAEQLFLPRGFAHGYCTLEPNTEIAYKCDAYYDPATEGGLYFADPDLAVDWPIDPGQAMVSGKDRAQPRLADLAVQLDA